MIMFTPLIINTKFFFPFVAPKTTFFRIIVEIVLAAYIFLVISNAGKYRPRINALTLAITLFLAVFILASFTGVNLARSFWSTYERMTGIWTMLHLYAFFIILSNCFKKKDDWDKFLGVSIIAGVFLSLYVLMGNQASTRGGGTIGNTSFMAAYLLFDVFFALILFLSKRGFWQIFSGVCLLILLPVLLTSTAQGAIVSFFLGLYLLTLGYFIFSKEKIFKRLAWAIILTTVIFGAILIIFQPAFVKDFVQHSLDVMQARFVVWENGLKGFLERPILGWGPENFNVVFTKYFNPRVFLSTYGGEIWFDRVHNIVFDTLVTTGVAGLVAYLFIFGIAIYKLLVAASRVIERKNLFLLLGLAILLIVYFLQNLLVFDMINSYLVFFLSLGFINFLTQKSNDSSGEMAVKRFNPLLAIVIILAILPALWWGNIKPMIANYYLIKALSSQYIDQTYSFFGKSLSTSMNKYEARENFSQRIGGAIRRETSEDMRPTLQKTIELTEMEMEKNIMENSLDFRQHLFLGELYLNSHRFSNDQEKIKRAQNVLEKAIELSPTNQQGYWQLAETRVTQGRIEEGITLLRKAVDLEPRLGNSHWYLAMAYQIAGQYKLAKAEVLEAEKYNFDWKTDLDNLRRVMDIYRLLGEDERLIPLLLEALERAPDDAKLWAALAASYANIRDYQKAEEAADRAAKIDESLLPEVEKFLKQLPK